MADITTDNQFLATDPEVLGLQRQRQLANLLTGQAFNQPQGQMISGHYVKPSNLQQALPMINAAIGALSNANLDTKQVELANALRQKQAAEIQTFGEMQQKDPDAALRYALSSNNPLLRDIAKEELKGIKLGEGEIFTRRNLGGGTTQMMGNPKYHAPLQIDTGTTIEIRDPKDPTKVIATLPKSQMPLAGHVLETDTGPMLVDTRTGKAQPITVAGQPVLGGKPLTSDQSNATAFGIRMKESNDILNKLEEQGVKNTGIIRSTASGIVGMTPFVGEHLQQGVHAGMNVLPGALGGPSAEQQQVDAARRNFVTAVLRKESGAAISASEFYNESQKYFPQPGDSDEVIKQKRHARETAIKAMEIQAGPGKRQIEQTSAPKKVVNFEDLK